MSLARRALVVRLRGELDIGGAQELRAVVDPAWENGEALAMIFDLSGLTFIVFRFGGDPGTVPPGSGKWRPHDAGWIAGRDAAATGDGWFIALVALI